jgi:hypothetical protein
MPFNWLNSIYKYSKQRKYEDFSFDILFVGSGLHRKHPKQQQYSEIND